MQLQIKSVSRLHVNRCYNKSCPKIDGIPVNISEQTAEHKFQPQNFFSSAPIIVDMLCIYAYTMLHMFLFISDKGFNRESPAAGGIV